MSLEDLLVVQDDAVVDADEAPVADGMVVGLDRRVALGVVAHVDERLRGLGRHRDLIHEGAGAGALLVDVDRSVGPSDRVANGVGATLGDRRQQRLGSQSPRDVTRGIQAVSGNSTHMLQSMLEVLPDGVEGLLPTYRRGHTRLVRTAYSIL